MHIFAFLNFWFWEKKGSQIFFNHWNTKKRKKEKKYWKKHYTGELHKKGTILHQAPQITLWGKQNCQTLVSNCFWNFTSPSFLTHPNTFGRVKKHPWLLIGSCKPPIYLDVVFVTASFLEEKHIFYSKITKNWTVRELILLGVKV